MTAAETTINLMWSQTKSLLLRQAKEHSFWNALLSYFTANDLNSSIGVGYESDMSQTPPSAHGMHNAKCAYYFLL